MMARLVQETQSKTGSVQSFPCWSKVTDHDSGHEQQLT